MAEYIKREDLRRAYEISLENDNHKIEGASAIHLQEHRHILHILNKIPAADVMPVKHGRWEERSVNVGTCTTGLFCSECNFPSLGWRYNYCHNCGCKMDLEVTNGLDQH